MNKPTQTFPGVKLVREGSYTVQNSRVASPQDAYRILADLALEPVEVFVVLFLDTRSRVTGRQEVTRGLLDSSLCHPREVFRAAIIAGASAIILAHNHPSGDPTPSSEDRAVTRQLVAAGQLLDVPVYDHVIIGGERNLSFATSGML